MKITSFLIVTLDIIGRMINLPSQPTHGEWPSVVGAWPRTVRQMCMRRFVIPLEIKIRDIELEYHIICIRTCVIFSIHQQNKNTRVYEHDLHFALDTETPYTSYESISVVM